MSDESKTTWLIIGLAGVYLIGALMFDSMVMGFVFLFVASVIVGLWYALKMAIDEEREKKRKLEQEKFEQRKATSAMRGVIDRTWEFPVEIFYKECEKANATQLNNEFSQRKIKQIVEILIKEVSPNIDLNKCGYYFETEQLTSFLAEGRKLTTEANAKKLAAQKAPKNASPDTGERTFIGRANSVSGLKGNQKRVKMLSDLIQDFNRQIEEIKQGEEAMKTLGMIYMQQQQKEGDWALAGGLADGLAGPVAGFMTASQVMENNREVRRHNEIMRNTSRDVLSGSLSLSSDRYELERQKKQTEERCKEAKEKIALSKPNAAEIWNHIQVGRYQIKKEKNGVLHIALPVHIETPFALDVPANVKTVVDGTLKAEVRFEDKLVGTVNFPLPLYGIPTNMTAEVTLDGMLDRSVEFSGEYTLKMLDSHNLWIMEA